MICPNCNTPAAATKIDGIDYINCDPCGWFKKSTAGEFVPCSEPKQPKNSLPPEPKAAAGSPPAADAGEPKEKQPKRKAIFSVSFDDEE